MKIHKESKNKKQKHNSKKKYWQAAKTKARDPINNDYQNNQKKISRKNSN